MNEIDEFEACLGYRFRNRELLEQALTHRSRHKNHNERLEFLGDSVLGFVVADSLYQRFPNLPEGNLTRMRASLVRRHTLASIARGLALGRYLCLGEGEIKNRGFERDSILADALEAVLGAIYLDGGAHYVHAVIQELFKESFSTIESNCIKDNKTQLQELLQKSAKSLPIYELVEQEGKDHELIFHVTCQIDHPDSPFLASGSSRRNAEQSAAGLAMNALESIDF